MPKHTPNITHTSVNYRVLKALVKAAKIVSCILDKCNRAAFVGVDAVSIEIHSL